MAITPGLLTDWPWKPLGSFKYVVLAPWMVKSIYDYMTADVEKDDQIIFNGLLYYIGYYFLDEAKHLPLWRLDGAIIVILLHVGAVEFLYYWLHRALHHHFLYNRYHSHHHSSIVTEPITSVTHPFMEHIAYFALFAIPVIPIVLTRTASLASIAGYVTYIDIMNNMCHCNFEFIPKSAFAIFPPLKHIMYTPSYHSLHHTQFRTNYSLFMPFYDYVYGTMDKSTDTLYEKSLGKKEESPNVVHLTHLTTLDSIYHMRLGFASLALKPHTSSKWYLWLLWPLTLWATFITRIYGKTFVVERNIFKNLKLQTWAIPKYRIQFISEWQRESVNSLIEEAILEAEEKGVKVLSLGLLNQGEELNGSGELYIRRNPGLKVKLVDGSSLAAAVVLSNIPRCTTQVVFKGNFNKVASYLALTLCHRGIQVGVSQEDHYEILKSKLKSKDHHDKLVLSQTYSQKTWLVGDKVSKEEQMKASKGTLIIPYSQFPPKKVHKDCFYYTTPSMLTPKILGNLDSCENWLPRRVMSAWRIAGIVHGIDGWKINECGNEILDIDNIWEATLQHGFTPLIN